MHEVSAAEASDFEVVVSDVVIICVGFDAFSFWSSFE